MSDLTQGHALDRMVYMSHLDEILMDILPEGWETDGFGFDSCLICPCGDTIEQDGICPQGCVSPLREMGLI
jgi:hypothetical protein